MIVASDDRRLRLITQHDHAALAADLMALWRHEGIAGHPRRQAILSAVREHDNGWQESDAAPLARAAGSVHDYRSIPPELRREIWLRGIERHLTTDPLVAALIAEHGRRLHQESRDDPEWAEFFDRVDTISAEIAEAEPEAVEVVAAYPHLRRVDGLSLALCDNVDAIDLDGLTLRRVDDDPQTLAYALTPFPFVAATRFRVAARYLPDTAWKSTVDLVAELARARWQKVEFRLQP